MYRKWASLSKNLNKPVFVFSVHILSVMLIVWPRQHHLEKSDSQKLCSASMKTIFAIFEGKTSYCYYLFIPFAPFSIHALITNLEIVYLYTCRNAPVFKFCGPYSISNVDWVTQTAPLRKKWLLEAVLCEHKEMTSLL